MKIKNFRLSRRSATMLAAAIGTLSLAIGAHAALNMRATDAVRTTAAAPLAMQGPARVALVIGNSRYPDANAPLTQPVNDARALSAALQRDGFDVETVENGDRNEMRGAVARLKAKIRPESVAMLFFAGYAVQAGRESYMIPVDAAIWKESDVRRDGTSVESVLAAMKQGGARAKLVVLDASRRNPYERRFRTYSHGLAPINTTDNALILSAAAPGQVVDDAAGANSVLVDALLDNLKDPSAGATAVFGKTRQAVTQATKGKQVPSVSSSLIDDVSFRAEADAHLAKAGS
ncbi:MAG: caspase family protein [Xanthobacteraceae bacterium]